MTKLLSSGSRGPDVRAVQDALNYHIRRLPPIKVDGDFGKATTSRVILFQTSNKLKIDGIVGPNTSQILFAVEDVLVPLFILPELKLTLPTFGARQSQGIQPPRLIPPLQWPFPPSPPVGPFTFGSSFILRPNSFSSLPDFSAPVNALSLKFTVPSRKDPEDPAVRSRTTILELINDLPVNSKFKVFLGDKVPDPTPRISPPGTGFSWGVEPVFDPLDPKGFGVKGNARYAIRVSDGLNGRPNIVFAAWGDGQAFLNFESKQGQSKPRLEGQGQVFLGFQGIF